MHLSSRVTACALVIAMTACLSAPARDREKSKSNPPAGHHLPPSHVMEKQK
jgi:hypothetical protein